MAKSAGKRRRQREWRWKRMRKDDRIALDDGIWTLPESLGARRADSCPWGPPSPTLFFLL